MKTLIPILVAVLLSGGTSWFIVRGGVSASPPTAEDADPNARDGARATTPSPTLARIKQLERELSALQVALSEVEGQPGAGQRVSVGGDDVLAAVEAWLAENAERVAELDGSPAALLAADGERKEDLVAVDVDVLLQMLDEHDSLWEAQDLWERIRKAGRMDDVIAEYEAMAEEDPHDPDLQVALGSVYVQKIFELGNSPATARFAMLADKSYDRALEIDDTHWEARFSKAVSLSNWPAFLGKSGEAIRQFETLLTQQEGQEPIEGFDQTYLFLGNMYQQTGKIDKAIETWRAGLSRFPEAEVLLQQLNVHENTDG